jgi:hypothetical protein
MLVMATVTNIGNARRHWPTLYDVEKNRPLTLEPGESLRVEIPEDLKDPYLAIEAEPVAPFVPIPVSPAEEPPSEDQE